MSTQFNVSLFRTHLPFPLPPTSMPLAKASATAATADGVEIYGNHCGPGHGDAGQPAIDELDAACKAHDAGYEKHGYFDYLTNVKLIGRLTADIFTGKLNLKQTAVAAVVIAAFLFISPICFNITVSRAIVKGAVAAGGAVVDGIKAAGSAIGNGAKAVWNEVSSWF